MWIGTQPVFVCEGTDGGWSVECWEPCRRAENPSVRRDWLRRTVGGEQNQRLQCWCMCLTVHIYIRTSPVGQQWRSTVSWRSPALTGRTGGLSPQITLILGFCLYRASLTDYSTTGCSEADGGLVMEMKECQWGLMKIKDRFGITN